jgi:hypothetical protein
MAAKNHLTAKTVAHPVLLPSGEKGRSVPAATLLYRRGDYPARDTTHRGAREPPSLVERRACFTFSGGRCI